MIRPIFAETERYGEYSKAGEFVYDHPFQWGSRRIGPDLAREGGKQSHLWHLLHLRDPAASTPQSVMPAYAHLERTKLAFSEIPARVEAASYLGAEYEFDIADADDVARIQARQIVAELVAQQGPDRVFADPDDPRSEVVMLEESKAIALIAYLQRLGTDLHAEPPAPTPPDTTPAATNKVASAEGAR
jgi:cytochrome c oxidase cbb3-type subunit I/II